MSLAYRSLVVVLVCTFGLMGCGGEESDPYVDWRHYGGDRGHTRFSKLDQINRDNVEQLEVAWTYHTGDAREDRRSSIEANPIIVDGVLYVTSPGLKVIALDAATGEEIWVFDPYTDREPRGVNRGVTYWEDGEDKRILFTAGWTSELWALDAETGEVIEDFGNNGVVDIGAGIRTPDTGPVSATSPGVVYKDLYILGTRVGEGPSRAAKGDLCAYNVRTGERVWRFHTIPRPGEFGHDTWEGDSWKFTGGANAWGGLTVDEERGMAFFGLGSPSYIFYGGNRAGKNLFANSVLALDAETGEYIWHFQLTHHDIWDYEPGAPPTLITVTRDGKEIDAVAQVSKRGDVFVLDRETGKPLFPVQEKKVPSSEVPGEEAYPTQPEPLKPPPYVRQGYTKDDITNRTPEARAYAMKRFKEMRSGEMFIPGSLEGTIIKPGFRGGSVWQGATFDFTNQTLYVNASEVPGILKMVPTEQKGRRGATDIRDLGERIYRANCGSCHGMDRSGNPPQYPELQNVSERLPQEEVKRVITAGAGMMPPFPNMSESSKEAVVAYLFGDEYEGDMQMHVDSVTKAAQARYPYVHDGWTEFTDNEGFPAITPPWGTLTALDMNEGTIKWQVPLGRHPDVGDEGMQPTGTDNLGGNLVTTGGLIFVGATTDEMFRAYDKSTGEVLWKTKLPHGGYATPSTYEVDGVQYIVIPAAGGGLLGTPKGDEIVAFALPEGSR